MCTLWIASASHTTSVFLWDFSCFGDLWLRFLLHLDRGWLLRKWVQPQSLAVLAECGDRRLWWRRGRTSFHCSPGKRGLWSSLHFSSSGSIAHRAPAFYWFAQKTGVSYLLKLSWRSQRVTRAALVKSQLLQMSVHLPFSPCAAASLHPSQTLNAVSFLAKWCSQNKAWNVFKLNDKLPKRASALSSCRVFYYTWTRIKILKEIISPRWIFSHRHKERSIPEFMASGGDLEKDSEVLPYYASFPVYGHVSEEQSLRALAFLKKSSNPTSQTKPETLLEHSWFVLNWEFKNQRIHCLPSWAGHW